MMQDEGERGSHTGVIKGCHGGATTSRLGLFGNIWKVTDLKLVLRIVATSQLGP